MAVRKPPYWQPIRLSEAEEAIGEIHSLRRSNFEMLQNYCSGQIISETQTLMDARDVLEAYEDDELISDDIDLISEYINIADELIEAYNNEWVRRQRY